MNNLMTDDFESGQVHDVVQLCCIIDAQWKIEGHLLLFGFSCGEGF